MNTLLIAYGATLVSLSVFDGAWLSLMGKRLYTPYIGHLMASSPKIVPILIFYPLYAFGVVCLVVLPALHYNYSLTKVFLLGAVLGCMAYGAYDLTNHATLRDWPLTITIVDMLWGTVLTGVVAKIATYVARLYII